MADTVETVEKQQKRIGVRFGSSGGRAFRRYPGRERHGGGVRGEVSRFSENSRRRMRERLLEFDWKTIIKEKRALWVTLTVREGNAQQVKEWLSNFRKRVDRRFFCWFVWRLEYQARGVAHLHLIIVFKSRVQAIYAQSRLPKMWVEVAGKLENGENNALGYAQHIRLVKGMAGIASYISDASKVQQAEVPEGQSPGRWWGVRNGDVASLDLAEIITFYGERVFTEYRRFVRSLRTGRKRSMKRRRTKTKRVIDAVEFFSPLEFMKWLVGEGLVFDIAV